MAYSYIVFMQLTGFLLNNCFQQAEQTGDFFMGTVPVLGRKSVERYKTNTFVSEIFDYGSPTATTGGHSSHSSSVNWRQSK